MQEQNVKVSIVSLPLKLVSKASLQKVEKIMMKSNAKVIKF